MLFDAVILAPSIGRHARVTPIDGDAGIDRLLALAAKGRIWARKARLRPSAQRR